MPTRIFAFDLGVRCAHTACGFEVVLSLTYLPLCAADKITIMRCCWARTV